MPELRRLTIVADDPRRLADFYLRVFDLETAREDEKGVFLSDGAFNLALVPKTGGRVPGLHALGFKIERMEQIREGMRQNEIKPHGAGRISDPDGNLLELSKGGFGSVTQKTPLPIRHIALYTPDPARLAEFYGDFFGMKEVALSDRSSIFVSDGYFNLALLYQRPGEEKNGLNHFGFYVTSIEEIRNRAEGMGVERGTKRPDRIPYSEYRLHDPEGNGIDISVKGWEV